MGYIERRRTEIIGVSEDWLQRRIAFMRLCLSTDVSGSFQEAESFIVSHVHDCEMGLFDLIHDKGKSRREHAMEYRTCAAPAAKHNAEALRPVSRST